MGAVKNSNDSQERNNSSLQRVNSEKSGLGVNQQVNEEISLQLSISKIFSSE